MGQQRYTTEDNEQLSSSPPLQGRGGTSQAVGAQAMLRPRGTICIVSPPKDRARQEATSCPGLAAQDQAATSPDRASKAGLRCLPSLVLPPAKVSCKSLPTPPVTRVPERRCKEKVLEQKGLAKGAGMACGVPKGPRFLRAPTHLERPRPGDPTQRLASIWEAPWRQKVPGGPSGEAPALSTVAGLWQPPALCWEEQSLSSS